MYYWTLVDAKGVTIKRGKLAKTEKQSIRQAISFFNLNQGNIKKLNEKSALRLTGKLKKKFKNAIWIDIYTIL